MSGFFAEFHQCVTSIPMRDDGSDECEHIGEEHVNGANCMFCPCEGYLPGEDDDDG